MEREYSQKYLQFNKDKRIVFDAKEVPFFRVAPDFSDLGRSPCVENQLKQRYPNLCFFLGCLVDGAVLIQDLLPTTSSFDFKTANALFNLARELDTTSNITLQIVDGGSLTYYLARILDAPLLQAKKPLLIFPGEGAKIVSQYLKGMRPSWDLKKAVYLPCKRTMNDKTRFELLVDYSPLPDILDTDTILIIDDVIATGQTMQTIAGELRKRYGSKQLIAASWLFLNPAIKENKNAPSGIKDVNITVASFALKGNYIARPPINSLSCFVRRGGKYDQIKGAFVQRYIDNPEAFQNIIKQIQSEFVIMK